MQSLRTLYYLLSAEASGFFFRHQQSGIHAGKNGRPGEVQELRLLRHDVPRQLHRSMEGINKFWIIDFEF